MNNIKFSIRTAIFLMALTRLTFLQAADTDKIVISVKPDRENAVYKKDETVTFRIDVKDGKGQALDWGSVHCYLSDDHYKTTEDFILAITGQTLEVKGKLSRPGFLQCEVKFEPGERDLKFKVKAGLAAAAVSPEEISPSREVPVDFEAFWESQKQLLAAVPLNAQMKKDEEASIGGIEVFDVQIACLDDVPVSGYFARPVGAKPKSLPIILWVQGAGVRSSFIKRYPGYLSMDINAHGIPNGQSKAYYDKLTGKDGRLQGYPLFGRENRDAVYFKNMFLRMIRALDFLCAQPEWDGKILAVIGHSQGGFQALVAGGLDDRVTFIGAGVPAGCDHTGMLRKRIAGWPKLVPFVADGKPDSVIAEVSRYYDAVNFAARYHGEAIVSVGFIDRTCPPTSVYAAYNQLKGDKSIIQKPAMGHAAPKDIADAFMDAFNLHITKTNKPQRAIK
ncbi:MAG: acetylxylan esterase [Verrucomicrobia bacterium]|nr:acetylxylan esterase [Verrucomicrobiota bacterium]